VSVILITVVLTWGSGFAKDNLNSVSTLDQLTKSDLSSFIFIKEILTSPVSNNLLIKNSSTNENIEIIGYKFILDKEHALNNQTIYYPTTISLIAGSLTVLPIICVPTNKFIIQLILSNNTYLSLSVNQPLFNNNNYCPGSELLDSELKLWLNTSNLSNFEIIDGNVVKWNDLSGNNNHALATTSLNGPKLMENMLNRQSVLRFDSVDDFLTTSNLSLTDNSYTIIVVFKNVKSNNISGMWNFSGNDHGFYISGRRTVWRGNGSFASQSVESILNNNYHIISVIKKAGKTVNDLDLEIYKNNQLLNLSHGTHTSNFQTSNNLGIRIGRWGIGGDNINWFYGGDFVEFLVYDKILSSSQRENIVKYLEIKYDLFLE